MMQRIESLSFWRKVALLALFTVLFQTLVLGSAALLKTGIRVSGGDQIPSPSFVESTGVESAARPEVNPPPAEESRLAESSRLDAPNLTHRVTKGDSLAKIWRESGFKVSDLNAIVAAARERDVDLLNLRIGETITILRDERSQVVGLSRVLKDGTVAAVRRAAPDAPFVVELKEPEIIEEKRTISGSISESLASSARALAVSYGTIDELVDLFSGRVEFAREIQPGDTFTIVYPERRTVDGRELQPGPIDAASITKGGRQLFAIRYAGKDGKARYFDEQGEVLGNYFLRYPLQFTKITSVFSSARFHPLLKKTRPHHGVDFAAPVGTAVRAVADGTVEIAANRGEAGNMVRIDHGERYTTEYMHLSKISSGIKPGAHIARGQVIGAVGATGLCSGPHLHFGFFDRGVYVDPLKITLPTMPTLGELIPRHQLELAVNLLQKERESIVVARVVATPDRRA